MSYNPPSFEIIQTGNFYQSLDQHDYEIKDLDPYDNEYRNPDPYDRAYHKFSDARDKVFKFAGDDNVSNWRNSNEIVYFDDLRSCICTQDILKYHYVVYHLSDPTKRLYLGSKCIENHKLKSNCIIDNCRVSPTCSYMNPSNENFNTSYLMCEDHRITKCYNCLDDGIRVGPRVKRALCEPCRNDILEYKIESGPYKGETVGAVEDRDPEFLRELYYMSKRAVFEEELPLRQYIRKHRWAFKTETLQRKKD